MASHRIGKNVYGPAAGGFTLVELLVVITIIGILIALLLPGVQAAREAGRKGQCANNLKQWGLAALQHEEAQGFYPGGGWGWSWVGDPDRGFGMNQPGGWIYNCLPFTDQAALHDLGYGNTNQSQRQTLCLQMIQTPLAIANCPTRRRSALFLSPFSQVANNYGGVQGGTPNVLARADYAACCGHNNFSEFFGGPGSLPTLVTSSWNDMSQCTGIVYECSEVKAAQISNGTSNVIFAGEKYEQPEYYSYSAGTNPAADNENMYVGMDNDISRSTYYPPMQDRPGFSDGEVTRFGSAHPQSCNFAFCDGSVHSISYAVDPATFNSLGRRNAIPDNSGTAYTPIDWSKL